MTAFSLSKRMSRGPVAFAVAIVAAFLAGLAFTTVLDRLGSTGDAPAPGATIEFTATAYCKGTTTASGIEVRRGIAAADPTLLPVGSVVSLTTGEPEFDGVYTVLDTGPRVQGRALDVYVWSCHEALAFGRRTVEATVLRLGWDPRASAESLVNRLFRRVGQRAVRRVPPAEAAPPAQQESDPQPDPAPSATPATEPIPDDVVPPPAELDPTPP